VSVSFSGWELVIQQMALLSAQAVPNPGIPLKKLFMVESDLRPTVEKEIEIAPAVGSDKTASHFARDFVIALRRFHCCRFVTSVDEAYARLLAAEEEPIQMPSVDTERNIDPECAEALCEEISSC
jgi:hypothetical protein